MDNKLITKTKLEPKRGGAGGRYVYRDWSHSAPSQTDWDAIEREKDLHPDARKLPVKLNAILNNREFSSIIVWLPHGRSWRILDRDRLTKEVLPLFFQNANFNSFVRLVNAWGFRRIKSGVNNDSYYHELFLRGMPHLHVRMKRLLSHEKKAPIGSIDECPNFDAMSKLPEVESGSMSSSLGSSSVPIQQMTTNHTKHQVKSDLSSHHQKSEMKEDFYVSPHSFCSVYTAMKGIGGSVTSTSSSRSFLERNSQESNTMCNNLISSSSIQQAKMPLKDSSVFTRQSMALAYERLRQYGMARLQASSECNESMQIMERQCGISQSRFPQNFSSSHLAQSSSPYGLSPHGLGHAAPLLSDVPIWSQAQARLWSLNPTTVILPASRSLIEQSQINVNWWDVGGQSSSGQSQYFSRITSSNAGVSRILDRPESQMGVVQQHYSQVQKRNVSNTDTFH